MDPVRMGWIPNWIRKGSQISCISGFMGVTYLVTFRQQEHGEMLISGWSREREVFNFLLIPEVTI